MSGTAAGAVADGTTNVDEEDLSHLTTKEKKKVLAQRIADAGKAMKRLDKEAGEAGERPKRDTTKKRKKGDKRSSKSTAEGSDSDDEDTSQAAVNTLKRGATFARLSNSKLQQENVVKLKNVCSSSMLVDELIVNCSLLSIDQHYAQHNSFPKCWDNIIAILEKVSRLAFPLKFFKTFNVSLLRYAMFGAWITRAYFCFLFVLCTSTKATALDPTLRRTTWVLDWTS